MKETLEEYLNWLENLSLNEYKEIQAKYKDHEYNMDIVIHETDYIDKCFEEISSTSSEEFADVNSKINSNFQKFNEAESRWNLFCKHYNKKG